MKKIIVVLLLAILVVFNACKKESTPKPVYPIEGYWTGKFGLGTVTPAANIVMAIEPGGKVVLGNNTLASGNSAGDWTLVGNEFKATVYISFLGQAYTYKATFNTDGKLENGTVGPGTATTGYGTWYADRKN